MSRGEHATCSIEGLGSIQEQKWQAIPLASFQRHYPTPFYTPLTLKIMPNFSQVVIGCTLRYEAKVAATDLGLGFPRWLTHFSRPKCVLSQKQAASCQAAR